MGPPYLYCKPRKKAAPHPAKVDRAVVRRGREKQRGQNPGSHREKARRGKESVSAAFACGK